MAETPDPTLADLAAHLQRLDARQDALDAEIRGIQARIAWLEREVNRPHPHPDSYWLKSALYRADQNKEGA